MANKTHVEMHKLLDYITEAIYNKPICWMSRIGTFHSRLEVEYISLQKRNCRTFDVLEVKCAFKAT